MRKMRATSLLSLAVIGGIASADTINFDIGGRSETTGARNYITMFGDVGSGTTTGTVTDTVNGQAFTATFELSVSTDLASAAVIAYRGNESANNFLGVNSPANTNSEMNSSAGEIVTLTFLSIDNPRVQFDGFTKITSGNASGNERWSINGNSIVAGINSLTDLTQAPYNSPQSLTVKAELQTDGTSPSRFDIGEIGLQFSDIPFDPGFLFEAKAASSPPFLNPIEGALDSLVKANEGWYNVQDQSSNIPGKMAAGQNGFAIVTTNDIVRDMKNLDAFVKHKQNRGFQMHIVTEDQYGSIGKVGQERAGDIRTWLHQNYQDLNLCYVMFIGNPHPTEGTVPMWMAKGKYPSDIPYGDLTGATWDLNGDGVIAQSADWGPGGADGVMEVYPGRINVYGEHTQWAKVSDADHILQKTMDFENEEGDLSWRHNTLMINHGTVGVKRYSNMINEFLDPLGAEYDVIMQAEWGSRTPLSEYDPGSETSVAYHNRTDKSYGYISYHGHGSAASIVGSLGVSYVPQINPVKQAGIMYCGGCSVATPEQEENIVWALVRYAGVGMYGGTRPVSGFSSATGTRTWAFTAPLYWGQSNGEALYRFYSEGAAERGSLAMTNYLINLFGDPSVVTMPQRKGAAFTFSPPNRVELSHEYGSASATRSHSYYVKNNGTASADYTAVSNESWLSVSPSNFTLAPGESTTLTISCAEPTALPEGETHGSFELTSSNDGTKTRDVTVNHYLPAILDFVDGEQDNDYYSFNKSTKYAPIYGTGKIGRGVMLDPDAYFNNRIETKNAFKQFGRKNGTISFWYKMDQIEDRPLAWSNNVWSLDTVGGNLQFTVYQNLFYGIDLEDDSNEQHPTVVTTTETMVAGQWHHIVLSVDNDNAKFSAWKDGVQIVTDHALPYSNLGMGFPDKPLIGWDVHGAFDELWNVNKYATQADVEALARGGWSELTSPSMGTTLGNSAVTLKWSANQSATTYEVYLGNDLAALSSATTASAEFVGSTTNTNLGATALSGANYWRVDVVTAAGTNKGMIWKFNYDPAFNNSAPVFGAVELANAAVGDNTYAPDLRDFVTDADADAVLTFELISGPDWIDLNSNGEMGTAFGPNASDVGENNFEVKVTDQWGAEATTTFTINVVQ